MQRRRQPTFYLLLMLLFLKACAALYLIRYAAVGLAPDEAQYWTWSQSLDWGYYSKPPGIAWQIWLGCQLWGNSEFGVRFFSVIFSFLLSLSVYFLAKASGMSGRGSFWSGLIVAFSPIGILSSLAATTDGGYILAWTIASAFYLSGLRNRKPPSYLIIGLIIAFGALFKWPVYALWIAFFWFAWKEPALRSSKKMIGGIVISFLGIVPSLIWNFSHDWATFQHVWQGVVAMPSGTSASRPLFNGNVLEFFGAQLGVLSPLYFFMFLFALYSSIKKKKGREPSENYLLFVTFSGVLFCFVFSLFNKLQANWGVFIYPTGIVLLSKYCSDKKRLLLGATAISLILSGLVISFPFIQSRGAFKSFPIPYRLNAFRHSVGWDRLEDLLLESGYDPEKNFTFSDKYQMSSILSFYSPKQKRAYFLNLNGVRKNQFSYWKSMAQEQVGKIGFFVMAENSPHYEKGREYWEKNYQDLLSQYFREVVFVGDFPLFESYGKSVKGALIFKCVDYNGLEPKKTEMY